MAEITREKIENRISTLRELYQASVNNANAYHGAIQDCEWFLSELDRDEDPQVVSEVIDG